MSPRELDIAYAAGLFDGEGCIGVYHYRDKYKFNMTLCMRTPYGPQLFKETFGGHVEIVWRTTKGARRHYFLWRATHRQALAALRLLLPHLLEKRDQADRAIRFQEIKDTKRRIRRAKVTDAHYEPEDAAEMQRLATEVRELKRVEFAPVIH